MTEALQIDITVSCAAWSEAVTAVEETCRNAALAAFQEGAAENASGSGPAEVSLVLSDDVFVRSLNKQYRDQDKPTNVLSFAISEGGGPIGEGGTEGMPEMLGDVVIAYETASAEAAEEGKSLTGHLCHLVVHGMLHLLGYDHQSEAEAQIMERIEARTLDRLGVTNTP